MTMVCGSFLGDTYDETVIKVMKMKAAKLNQTTPSAHRIPKNFLPSVLMRARVILLRRVPSSAMPEELLWKFIWGDSHPKAS